MMDSLTVDYYPAEPRRIRALRRCLMCQPPFVRAITVFVLVNVHRVQRESAAAASCESWSAVTVRRASQLPRLQCLGVTPCIRYDRLPTLATALGISMECYHSQLPTSFCFL